METPREYTEGLAIRIEALEREVRTLKKNRSSDDFYEKTIDIRFGVVVRKASPFTKEETEGSKKALAKVLSDRLLEDSDLLGMSLGPATVAYAVLKE